MVHRNSSSRVPCEKFGLRSISSEGGREDSALTSQRLTAGRHSCWWDAWKMSDQVAAGQQAHPGDETTKFGSAARLMKVMHDVDETLTSR
jgi:hypothetical protein